MSPPTEDLVHRVRPAAGSPEGALVLLHGRGADENDLFPVIDFLDPERRLVGITVRGPLSLPPGGWHWYAVARVGFPDPETFFSTLRRLEGFLDALPQVTGVPWERTVLGGFSQGTVMSYALGLGAGRPRPRAILALSGFIPAVPGFELDLESRRGLAVAIAHGALDPVISVEFGREARDRLTRAGLSASYRESAMGHTIDPRLLPELQGWVRSVTATDESPPTPTRPSAAEGAA
jgi:phospholipase/carboxylesterase